MKNHLPLFVLAMVLSAGFIAAAHAQATEKTGPDLLAGGRVWLASPTPEAAKLSTIATSPGSNPPGLPAQAMRIEVLKPADPFYMIQIGQTPDHAVSEGTLLRWRFWARSPTANPMRAVIEKAGPPWTSVGQLSSTLTPQWKLFSLDCTTKFSAPSQGLGVRFQVGQQAGTVEIAGVTLEDLGPDPRLVEARAAVQPAAIAARIQKYRTAKLTIEVRNAAGQPLPGAAVHIQQTRHAFLFGANIFNLQPENHEVWQKAYQERFTALLNYATLPFYWSSFEPQPGRPQYARLDAMAAWCSKHGLTTKGHPLVWHEAYPDWAPRTADQAVPLLQARVHDIVVHYQGRVAYWDVLNEINNAGDGVAHNGEAQWVARDGGPTVVATALDWARQAIALRTDVPAHADAPPAKVIYNDFDTGSQNQALLQALADRHQLPDVIGIQSHMHDGPWPAETVWQTAQDFARFGRPIHFTEVTVISGPRRDSDPNKDLPDWLTTPEGEAAQAEYVTRFYSILFSHPALRAITWWDLSDRGAWRGAPAGLVRKDMSPKPAYERLMKLIHGEWWTDASGRTGDTGQFTSRAFFGEYVVTVTDATGRTMQQSIDLPIDGGDKTVSVAMP